jgi:hypothetical protein
MLSDKEDHRQHRRAPEAVHRMQVSKLVAALLQLLGNPTL